MPNPDHVVILGAGFGGLADSRSGFGQHPTAAQLAPDHPMR
jgi:NADH dehydrogenase FAD-containing subunit